MTNYRQQSTKVKAKRIDSIEFRFVILCYKNKTNFKQIWIKCLSTKVHIVKAMVSSSSHVWMWESDHKKGWTLRNWCFWIVVSERTLESPLNCKEIKSVLPKGNQSWIFTGRTDAKAKILWLPNAKIRLIGKDPDAGKAQWGLKA